jgi:hypothetical protein
LRLGRFEKGAIFEDDEDNDSDAHEESPEIEPDVQMMASQSRGNSMGKKENVPFPCLCGANFSLSGSLNCGSFGRSLGLLFFNPPASL